MTYDLSVTKNVVLSGQTIDPETGLAIYDEGDMVTFRQEVCYQVDPNDTVTKENIYVEEVYPGNLEYVSHTAPVNFDQHVVGKKLIWRSFPITNDGCVSYDVTYRINDIEGTISTDAIIGSAGQYGQNL